MVEHEMVDVLC